MGRVRRIWRAIKRRPVPTTIYASRFWDLTVQNDFFNTTSWRAADAQGAAFEAPKAADDGSPGIGTFCCQMFDPDVDYEATYGFTLEGKDEEREVFVKYWDIEFMVDATNLNQTVMGHGHIKMLLFSLRRAYNEYKYDDSTWHPNRSNELPNPYNIWAVDGVEGTNVGAVRSIGAYTQLEDTDEVDKDRSSFWPYAKLRRKFKGIFRVKKFLDFPGNFGRTIMRERILATPGNYGGSQTPYYRVHLRFKFNRNIKVHKNSSNYFVSLPLYWFCLYCPNFSTTRYSYLVKNAFNGSSNEKYGFRTTVAFVPN